MPIYEYRCDNDHTFEAFQAMADDALDSCEVCGAPARRVLSAPAVHFKGSGFYTTDYARKGKKGPSSDGDSSKGDSAKGEKKGESKSDGGSSSGKSESKAGSSAKSD
jgi:putative FmdB family regulatory protein